MGASPLLHQQHLKPRKGPSRAPRGEPPRAPSSIADGTYAWPEKMRQDLLKSSLWPQSEERATHPEFGRDRTPCFRRGCVNADEEQGSPEKMPFKNFAWREGDDCYRKGLHGKMAATMGAEEGVGPGQQQGMSVPMELFQRNRTCALDQALDPVGGLPVLPSPPQP